MVSHQVTPFAVLKAVQTGIKAQKEKENTHTKRKFKMKHSFHFHLKESPAYLFTFSVPNQPQTLPTSLEVIDANFKISDTADISDI